MPRTNVISIEGTFVNTYCEVGEGDYDELEKIDVKIDVTYTSNILVHDRGDGEGTLVMGNKKYILGSMRDNVHGGTYGAVYFWCRGEDATAPNMYMCIYPDHTAVIHKQQKAIWHGPAYNSEELWEQIMRGIL
ncbi:MAG: hypothetical protein J1E39_04525 [Eubacterium sp.]|nr:hypothetical protein [Eubacterium sp.]